MRACKHCGQPVTNRSELTLQGFHPECGAARQRDEITQLIEKQGPHYERWARRLYLAARRHALDSEQLTA